MNVKMMSVCLACAGALLAGCGNSREKNAAAAAERIYAAGISARIPQPIDPFGLL